MTGITRGIVGPEVTALVVPDPICRKIRAHVGRAIPQECCGLLAGRVGGARAMVTAAIPSPNLAPDPETGFEIDAALLLKLQRRSRETDAAVLGHYHSHPQGPAAPSSTDLERAWVPGHIWLIAAPGGTEWVFTARLAVEEKGRVTFRPLELLMKS